MALDISLGFKRFRFFKKITTVHGKGESSELREAFATFP